MLQRVNTSWWSYACSILVQQSLISFPIYISYEEMLALVSFQINFLWYNANLPHSSIWRSSCWPHPMASSGQSLELLWWQWLNARGNLDKYAMLEHCYAKTYRRALSPGRKISTIHQGHSSTSLVPSWYHIHFSQEDEELRHRAHCPPLDHYRCLHLDLHLGG